MTSSVFFSIVIPAKGRPDYLREAIWSVVNQNYNDFELIVSNNGADITLKKVVGEFDQKANIRYIEHADVLSMPKHWESITQLDNLQGQYLLILTDRSFFRKNALKELHKVITDMKSKPDLISWPWDVYLDDVGVCVEYPQSLEIKILDPIQAMLDSINNNTSYPYLLPRALNSCIRVDVLNTMRQRFGAIFRPISPDFTFAFLSLLTVKELHYINRPLFISQGLKVSNGGKAMQGDATSYFNTLGLSQWFHHVPMSVPLVQNSIHEDFLNAIVLSDQKNSLLPHWSLSNYFNQCLLELAEKRQAGVLSEDILNTMEAELHHAITDVPLDVKLHINLNQRNNKLYLNTIGMIKGTIVSYIPFLYKCLLLIRKNNKFYPNIKKAAGFYDKKY